MGHIQKDSKKITLCQVNSCLFYPQSYWAQAYQPRRCDQTQHSCFWTLKTCKIYSSHKERALCARRGLVWRWEVLEKVDSHFWFKGTIILCRQRNKSWRDKD